MKIPKIEYEVYYPLYNDNDLEKLNLTFCQGSKIGISIQVKIDGELDKYNAKSDYYNNICSKATSESRTDICLNDRRNEFVYNNYSLCEENCELIEYNSIKEKVKCSCDIKTSIQSYDEIKFNKVGFFKSFTDIKNMININVLKCYKIVFKIKELQKNYGFFIVSFLVLFYFITLFIFILSSFSNYKKEIKNIIWALKFNEISIKNNQIIKNPVIIDKNIKKDKKKLNLLKRKNKMNNKHININKNKNNSKLSFLNLKRSSESKIGTIEKKKLIKIIF